MLKNDALIARVEKICLALPETSVSTGWGSPHYKVRGKIFAGCDDKEGKLSIYVQLDPAHADALIAADPRASRSQRYKAAVLYDITAVKDWSVVERLLAESHALTGAKKTRSKKSPAKTTVAAKSAAPKRSPAKKPPAKKPPAKKPPAKKKRVTKKR